MNTSPRLAGHEEIYFAVMMLEVSSPERGNER